MRASFAAVHEFSLNLGMGLLLGVSLLSLALL